MFYIKREGRRAAQRGTTRSRFPCRVCTQEINASAQRPRRIIIDAIKAERGCVDCGLILPEHPEVFDFDHLPGVDKTLCIADCITKGTVEEMLAEIDKCEVVCSNCHRIRTRQRGSNKFGNDDGPRE